MNKILLFQMVALLFCSMALGGQTSPSLPKDPDCLQIYTACQNAGFVFGEAKEGKGLWVDCIDPILQGTVAKKSVIPLPSVPAQVVAACKQKHPKFGSGRVGN